MEEKSESFYFESDVTNSAVAVTRNRRLRSIARNFFRVHICDIRNHQVRVIVDTVEYFKRMVVQSFSLAISFYFGNFFLLFLSIELHSRVGVVPFCPFINYPCG